MIPKIGGTFMAIGALIWALGMVVAVFTHDTEIMWKGFAIFVLLVITGAIIGFIEIEREAE